MSNRGVVRARGALLASSALLALAAVSPAAAQTVVPVIDNPGHATVTPGPTGVDVDLNNANQLVRWKTFSVSQDASVTFHTADTNAHYSVLNLVTSNQISQIDGKILANPNIAVWLSNPAGVVFGSSGSFSGGSLVLTTSAMTADQARFDNTTPASLTGTATLGGMPANAGLTLSTGSTVTTLSGGVILAGQIVKVQGNVTAAGDVALVAADTATVPVDLFSPISITINAGATVGAATVDAGGQITAAHVTIGGAAASGFDVLLSIDPNAKLIATAAADGRVVLAAGRSSDETDAGGTPVVQLVATPGTPATTLSGTGHVALGGVLTAPDRVWVGASTGITGAAGTITAGGTGNKALTVASGGALTLAQDLTATHGTLTVSATGDAALSGNLAAGTASDVANLTVTAGGALTLGRTDGTTQAIKANDDVTLTAGNGALSGQGPLLVEAGLSLPAGSIYLSQAGTGGITLPGAMLVAGVDDSGQPAYTGDVFVQQVTGDVALGTVDAATFNLPADDTGARSLAGTLFADRITTAADLTLRSTGAAIRVGEARSRTGNVSLTAATDVTGNALLTAPGSFGVANVFAPTAGKTASITATGLAQLGTASAGAAVATPATANQVSVTAATITADTLAANDGDVVATATGTLQAGLVTAARDATLTAGEAVLGGVSAGRNITIGAGVVRGPTPIAAPAAGLRVGTVNASGALAITASGDARLGTVADGGTVTVQASSGSVTGLVNGDPVSTVTGGATLTAGSNVSVGTGATRPTTVSLLSVDAGGAIDVRGGTVRIGAIGAASTPNVSVTAGSALSIDHIGTGAKVAQAVTLRTDADTPSDGTNLVVDPATGKLRAGYGFAILDTSAAVANALTVTVGHAAQLQQASAGTLGAALVDTQVAITADAIAAQVSGTRNGSLAMTARAGDLYLGSPATLAASFGTGTVVVPLVAAAARNITLTKTGADGAVRINGAIAAGSSGVATTGNVTIQSDTDILARAIVGYATIDLGARGTVGGLLTGETVAGDGLRIGAGESGGATDLVATTGDVRVGTLTGDTRLGIQAGGSVTGLATGDSGTTVAASLALAADTAVTIHGTVGGPLATATVGGITAATPTNAVGPNVTIAANRIAVGLVGGGGGPAASGISFAAGAGLSVDRFSASGDARFSTSSGGVAAYQLTATDVPNAGDPNTGVETLAPGYGFANLIVTSAGGASSETNAPGLLGVTAGGVAQIGLARAGQGTGLFTNADGSARAQVSIDAQAIALGTPPLPTGGYGTFPAGTYGAYAVNGGLSLTAEAGGLYLDHGEAGTNATLTKMGAATTGDGANELRIGSLASGLLAGSTGALRGDATITSATAVRANQITSGTGDIAITASNGDATGLLLATPATPDGRLLPAYAGMTLIATGAAAATTADPFRRITVSAPQGIAKIDAARAGQGGVYAPAAAAQVAIGAQALDAAAVTTLNGDLSLTTSSGLLRLGTADVARSASLSAATDAEVGRLTVGANAPTDTRGVALAAIYDIAITANGAVTGLRGTTQPAAIATNGLRMATTVAGQPDGAGAIAGGVQITGAGDVRLGSVTSTGAALAVTSGASLSGLIATDGSPVVASGFVAGAAPTNTGFADLVASHGSITIGAGTSAAIGRASTVARLGGAAVDGGSIAISAGTITTGTVEAAQNVRLTATSGLSADGTSAALVRDGSLLASTSAANGTGAAGSTTAATYGAANLTALSLLTRATPLTGTISVSAAQIAELGAVAAGNANGPALIGTTGALRDQITVTAGTIWLGSALAYNGNLNLVAQTGELTGLPFLVTDADATDGRLAVRRGRANLTSAVAGGRIVATATTTVQLGSVLAGAGVTLGTGNQIAITGTDIDAGTALTTPVVGDDYVAALGQQVTAANAAIALAATGTVRVGKVSAGTSVRIGNAASIYGASITANAGDVTLVASGQVGGLLFPTIDPAHPALVPADNGLRIGLAGTGNAADLSATGDVSITAAGSVRAGTLVTSSTSATALSIDAHGSVTGLAATAPLTGHRYLDLTARSVTTNGVTTGGNVTVGTPGDPTGLGVADLGQVTADAAVQVAANRLALGTVTKAASVRLAGGIGLAVDAIGTTSAVGAVTLSTNVAGPDEDPAARLFDPAAVDFTAGVAPTSPLSPGYGNANLSARGAVTVVAGDPAIAAGAKGIAQLGTVVGSSVTVTAEGLVVQSATTTAGALALTARTGALYLGAGSVTGTAAIRGDATLTKNGAAAGTGNEIRVGSLAAGGTILALSDTSIRANALTSTGVATPASAPADVLLRASQAVTGLTFVAPSSGELRIGTTSASGSVSDSAGGDIRLGTVAAGGTIGVTSSNGSVTGLGAVTGSSSLQVVASRGGVDVRGRNATLDLAAIGGITAATTPVLAGVQGVTVATLVDNPAVRVDANRIGLGTIAGSATVSSVADVGLSAASVLEAQSITGFRNVVAQLSGGSVAGIALSAGDGTTHYSAAGDPQDTLDGRYGFAQLESTDGAGAVTVTAAQAAQLGTLLGSSVTVTAQGIAIQRTDAGAAATARSGAVALTASNGGLYLESATASGAISLSKRGVAGDIVHANEVRAGTLTTGTTLTIASTTGIRARSLVAHGSGSSSTPALSLAAAAGDVSGLLTTAPDGAALLPAWGRADLAADASSALVAVTASGTAQLGSILAGSSAGGTSRTLNQIVVNAAQIDVATQRGATGALTQAAQAVNGNIVLRATGGRLRFGTGSAAGDITLAALTDIDLGAAIAPGTAVPAIVSATPATGTINIVNLGTNAEYLGDLANGVVPGAAFALSAAELNQLSAANVYVGAVTDPTLIGTSALVVGTGSNPLTLGNVAFGSTVGSSQLSLLGSNAAITLAGAVSGSGAARTLQIGGKQEAAGSTGLPTLAASLLARLDGGASLSWGGIVDLRANAIVFGNAALRGLATSVAAATDLVSHPTSALYAGSGTQATYLSAGSLQVRYRDYALFQNTGPNSSVTAGAVLGTGSNRALDLYSTGNNAANSFSLFGTINGQSGRLAVLLPEAQLEYAAGGTTRITLINSRVNGCVIAAPGAGCLTTVQLPPTLQLFDERQILLFDTGSNVSLTFEPLIATSNDALLGDTIAPALLGEPPCPPGSNPTTCPAPAQKGTQP